MVASPLVDHTAIGGSATSASPAAATAGALAAVLPTAAIKSPSRTTAEAADVHCATVGMLPPTHCTAARYTTHRKFE